MNTRSRLVNDDTETDSENKPNSSKARSPSSNRQTGRSNQRQRSTKRNDNDATAGENELPALTALELSLQEGEATATEPSQQHRSSNSDGSEITDNNGQETNETASNDSPELQVLAQGPQQQSSSIRPQSDEASASSTALVESPRGRRPSSTATPSRPSSYNSLIRSRRPSVIYPRTPTPPPTFYTTHIRHLLTTSNLALHYAAPLLGMTVLGPLIRVLNLGVSTQVSAWLVSYFSRVRLREVSMRDLHAVLRGAGLGTADGQVWGVVAVLGVGGLLGMYFSLPLSLSFPCILLQLTQIP